MRSKTEYLVLERDFVQFVEIIVNYELDVIIIMDLCEIDKISGDGIGGPIQNKLTALSCCISN